MTRAAITSPCTGSRKKSALPVMAIVEPVEKVDLRKIVLNNIK